VFLPESSGFKKNQGEQPLQEIARGAILDPTTTDSPQREDERDQRPLR
jgi:hypothetical protein